MTWMDARIRAALDGASAVVGQIQAALRVIGPRTADLLADTATSDAGELQRTYAVARNQMCHAAIGLVTTLSAAMAGAGMALSGSLSAGLWVVVWEGLQFMRAMRAGLSRTRSRRDRWLGDTPSYLAGIDMGMAIIAWDRWWFAASFLGLMLVVWATAMAFGRTTEERDR
jgi:hypothetical protein